MYSLIPSSSVYSTVCAPYWEQDCMMIQKQIIAITENIQPFLAFSSTLDFISQQPQPVSWLKFSVAEPVSHAIIMIGQCF